MTGKAAVGPKLSSPRSQWRKPARDGHTPPWPPLCGVDSASSRGLTVPTATNRTERAPRLTSPGGNTAGPMTPAPHAENCWGLGFPSGELIFF